jgi:hypothetical protein
MNCDQRSSSKTKRVRCEGAISASITLSRNSRGVFRIFSDRPFSFALKTALSLVHSVKRQRSKPSRGTRR